MTDTLSLLKLRRSVPPQFLSAPGPEGAELGELLAIAARVPIADARTAYPARARDPVSAPG